MTDYQLHKLFYQQFNTVIANHAEWLKTPQGCMEVLRDEWKGKAPIVRIDSPFEENTARDILDMIRARQAANPVPPPNPKNLKKIRKQIAAASAKATYKEEWDEKSGT
jgi:hypothetical protein